MEAVIIILIILAILIIISGIKIVPQAQVFVIERLGTYRSSLGTGPHYVIPVLDKVAKRVSIKEQVVDFKPQPVITKDNVTMQIDT
ncbi:MAG: peptidase, partial [Oscillospiraceae bacterium]|nr:peptidase [Oscillospiraceae bacterium]